MNDNLGFAHYWSQGDAVSHGVAYLLLLMSVISWYYILSKALSSWRIRRSASSLEGFWQAPTLNDAIAVIKPVDTENVYAPLAIQAADAAGIRSPMTSKPAASLNAGTDLGELVTRTLRREINRVSSRLESGLTLLASVGSTAPFVGLFGTVWGIYHALMAVSASGTVQIDKVAGPVGEALIMTALGLVVAIPAVLAYNAFTRVNRVTLAELDAFAHDLHAYLTTGSRVGK
ncbi:MotA/TolQ/ExbB proton channel family protein [Glaciimonas sp. CA11.2]|uniref:MotA/TolQ/ExbB proton channel family protein n=1 Tax=unclassified Glaciimonas TaxID=2644401 RepID=UPI002AB52264|nr:MULTISPECIES: MotA/TolQ/ExbB proton channel family protein [unclassified Glaciimonas]MDY7545599.1 MotA/TolQ/ExbB proton channel family protein [Glaciimonas sp. CA11.2]MEB0012715.1 MotA/TolQ/ExbB proton channel family protein [Glaciimonas sp. Cout2]MEB0082194.1 MotA/TolQ/ExbB proton channel family protein [Glaciimonas sp. Gout2]MEB0162200.1 MotA/TolQ/ExbB proton channel family protein [Glaciimonas sp. CA11.2]